MRDVRRYVAAVHGTTSALQGEITLADVLALEAVRVFLPDVFVQLHGAVDALTQTSSHSYGRTEESPHLSGKIEQLLQAAGSNAEVVQALIQRLFPAAQRHIGGSHYGSDWEGKWLRDRRVAHEDILKLYLERLMGRRLQAFTDAERAWGCLSDRRALERCLHSIDPERVEEVIASLEAYEDQYSPEHVVPGTIVLLNLLPELPEKPRGVFEFDTHVLVGRVAYRLLRSLGDTGSVESAVREILPELNSLSSRFHVLNIVGYREGVGHELVSEEAAVSFEKQWRAEVLSTLCGDLEPAKEHDLLRVLLFTKREADASEGTLCIPDTQEVTLALLQAARTDVKSQTFGSRAVRRSPRLAWDVLVEVLGDEESLRQRIESLKAAQPTGAEDLLELVDRYLGGWRPQPFSNGDDD
jgi:hypothetical protein